MRVISIGSRWPVVALLLLVAAANPTSGVTPRPDVRPGPYDAGVSMPYSPARDGRRCFVKHNNKPDRDDAAIIKTAFDKCNNGGTVILDQTYQIGSPLDLTFLQHIDVIVTGEIHFNVSGVYYWAENSFKYEFQNQSVYWKWGGEDVNIYGDLSNEHSIIDGHGESFWEEGHINKTVSTPALSCYWN
jgi:galacturan 1,4-alpha-galacturonidase